MNNNIEIRIEPLEGEWAQEAMDLYNIDHLVEMQPAQGDWAERRVIVEFWLVMAGQLGLSGEDDRAILRNMQEYVAVTPPQARCPCKHGVVLARVDDHYPDCENTFAQRAREMAAERYQVQQRELREQEEAMERRRQMEIVQARDIHRQWRRCLAPLLPTETLQRMRDDCGMELELRYKTPTH